MAKAVTTITLTGPFFTKDIRKTIRQNIRVLTDAIADEGQVDVRAQMTAGEGRRYPLGGRIHPNRVSGHVIGRTSSLTGRRWAVTAKISVNNSGWSKAQGIKLMAAAAVVERETHAFRRTAGRLRRARAINQAELLKGLV